MAFVYESAVLSTLGCPQRYTRLGVLSWKSQARRSPSSELALVSVFLPSRFSSSYLQLGVPEKAGCGPELKEGTLFRITKSHVTLSSRLASRLDLSLGLTQQLWSPHHGFTEFQPPLWKPPSPFPFSFQVQQ